MFEFLLTLKFLNFIRFLTNFWSQNCQINLRSEKKGMIMNTSRNNCIDNNYILSSILLSFISSLILLKMDAIKQRQNPISSLLFLHFFFFFFCILNTKYYFWYLIKRWNLLLFFCFQLKILCTFFAIKYI